MIKSMSIIMKDKNFLIVCQIFMEPFDIQGIKKKSSNLIVL